MLRRLTTQPGAAALARPSFFPTAAKAVQKPDLRILHTLVAIASKHDKPYCFPSLATIAARLKTYTGRALSARTLIRHLHRLQLDGYIWRTRRHRRRPGLPLELHSTLYRIMGRTVHLYRRMRWAFHVLQRKPVDNQPPYAVTETAQQREELYRSKLGIEAHAPP